MGKFSFQPCLGVSAPSGVLSKVCIENKGFILAVAVGIPITRYPPHKTVRALLRIRLPPWMCGVKACHGIGMQDTRSRNPSVEERLEPLATHIAALTAMDQHHPPQSAKPMLEDP